MTREEADELLSRLAEALTLVMRETGVRFVDRVDGTTYVSRPLWFRPVPVSEAIGALLGHAVAVRLQKET